MDKTTLVEEDITAGARLLMNLRKIKMPISAVFWRQLEPAGRWRLVIASSEVDRMGPMHVYERLLKEIGNDDDLSHVTLDDLSVISPNSHVVRNIARKGHPPSETDVAGVGVIWASSGEADSDLLVYKLMATERKRHKESVG